MCNLGLTIEHATIHRVSRHVESDFLVILAAVACESFSMGASVCKHDFYCAVAILAL